MIGLDTNLLARYFVAEQAADPATESQRQAARQLIESGQPRSTHSSPLQVEAVFSVLLGLPSLSLEDRPALEQALSGLGAGLDFADALHHASCRHCESIASFDDRGFARRIRQLNLPPRVMVPS